MKFKAFLSDHGVHLLERRFIPAFDKIGRTCHLYLTRDHAFLLHNLLTGDGVQAIAQFKKEVLFEDYRISSQNDDRIAFTIDLSLLHRALKSGISMTEDKLQIKLIKKRTGYKSAVIQDVPVSKPLSRAEVFELQAALDMAQDIPESLVQIPDLSKIQSLVERLKHVGDLLDVAITRYGDLHLQVSTTLINVGAEYRKLKVLGVKAIPPPGEEDISPSLRTEMAIQRGEASSVQVSMRHFGKSLQCHLAKPDSAFYGISPLAACLTIIFQFFIPGTRQTDKSISLHCRLPVLDTGSS